MDTLIDGFRTFRRTAFPHHQDRFRHLAVVGQSPSAAVVSCCDSRVDPQMIFSAAPGDLFIIRNVANLVPPYTPSASYHGTCAALEFAVRQLAVRDVIVMGHTLCGGVRALMERASLSGDFIGAWMTIAADVRDRLLAEAREVGDAVRARAEREVVRASLTNLMTFPWIRERVDAGTLSLRGCLFDVAAADLLVLDAETGEFRSADEPSLAACG